MTSEKGTLAELDDIELDLKDERVEDGLEMAMASYRQFLEETPESAMTPEALRRIADLSVEKEYGYVGDEDGADSSEPAASSTRKTLEKPEVTAAVAGDKSTDEDNTRETGAIASVSSESDGDFEKRVARSNLPQTGESENFAAPVPEGEDDLENANAEEAVKLYKKLLREYPLYERNDQVLYQLSRAYENLGKVEKAMEVMNQFVETYPNSRYMDEVQFRRAEYYFVRKKFLSSEKAYEWIVNMGSTSSFYELALYKLGWSFYKQYLYEEALHRYFALLDYKVSIGYDFDREQDSLESKRIDDTYRVVSLSFSNLGGPEVVADYFNRFGSRSYEDKVYSHLGEFYLKKRRYSDAAATYQAFIELYPFDEVSPHFNMRVIEIYKKGGFGKLVVEAKKEFAETYALDSEYWNYFESSERPDVIGFLKSNLKDLANHYHALYQDQRFKKKKAANYAEALLWYRAYLSSFPKEEESPAINFQMAELMLENKDYGEAAVAYENTAYNYPRHEKSSPAGYAAVYAHREHLKVVSQGQRGLVKQKIIQSSLKFADTYPEHEKVTIVLGAAADDLYEMKNYELAIKTAHKLIGNYPDADKELRRSAWLVVSHSSFELKLFADAETGYLNVLDLTARENEERKGIIDNLAASIYKQGEQANVLEDYKTAAEHFLRVSKLAPTSKIRPAAEYDGAAALIELEDWGLAAEVLLGFRKTFPQHKLQPEVTKKIAFVYREDGKLELAAAEYERIEQESDDEDVRRGSLVIAAELYHETGAQAKELAVYKRYVGYFPKPVEPAVETYSKMATLYKEMGDRKNHLSTLETIVKVDKSAGAESTARTRYLASQAALTITEPLFERFTSVKLVQPLEENILKKRKYMKAAIKGFSDLIDYKVADVTAATTYYMGEIYFHFSRALMDSERPDNLGALEMEQYELALEEQIYPFEDKAIAVHEKNIELLHNRDIASRWIDKSIARLAKIFPAVYARPEQGSEFVATIDSFRYATKKETEQLAESAEQEGPDGDQAESSGESEAGAETGSDNAAQAGAGPAEEAPETTGSEEQGGDGVSEPEPAVDEKAADSAAAG
ncbi:MAG: tetratricopeptide repeat protein [Pseudomonadota bacterium]